MARRILNVTMRPIGDWDEAMRQMMILGPEIKKGLISAQYQLGRELKRRVLDHIRNQDLNWRPLADSTAKHKGHDTILVDSFNYFSNIRVWQEELIVYVGVKRGITEPNGMETSLVASFHEFGLRSGKVNIPKRPLWMPTYEEMGGAKGIRNKITEGLGKSLERQGFRIKWR